ncbi:MAG: ATP-dependent DNA ligase [Myxococcota bacterium]
MLLYDVVSASKAVAATRSRLAKREALATLLRRLTPEEAPVAISYLAGYLPQGRVGVGYALVSKLDPGPPPDAPRLGLLEVHRRLGELARIQGPGSKKRRTQALGALFASARPDERRFLGGLLVGELRQGALVGVMTEAVADATGIDGSALRRAAMLAGDVVPVATAALTEGAASLARFELTLFRPVLPMLASPAEDVEVALERLGEAAFEVKLDGARVQVHKAGDEVRVYSRRRHDVTAGVPEIVEAVRAFEAEELILDGEAIALRPDGSPHAFQTTMRRFGRRSKVEEMRASLPLSHLYFDVLYQEGQSLIDTPAAERIARLDTLLPDAHRVERVRTSDPEEASAFYDRATGAGHEGLMAKSLAAGYEAGSRGFSWLKLKPAHTLDLVVLAVEEGSGRRRGWLSNLHLGARDGAGGFVMLGKTFKGMTDAMLAWQTERLRELALGEEGYVLHVKPELVVEVAFSDVQESPHYPGGLALRFARLKAHRPDKSAADAATLDEVRAIHAKGHRA